MQAGQQLQQRTPQEQQKNTSGGFNSTVVRCKLLPVVLLLLLLLDRGLLVWHGAARTINAATNADCASLLLHKRQPLPHSASNGSTSVAGGGWRFIICQ